MTDDRQETPRDARDAEGPAADAKDDKEDEGGTAGKGHQRDEGVDASSTQAQQEQDRAVASGEENPT